MTKKIVHKLVPINEVVLAETGLRIFSAYRVSNRDYSGLALPGQVLSATQRRRM